MVADNILIRIKKHMPSGLKNSIKQFFYLFKKDKMLKKSKRILPYDKERYPRGINLIGDIQAETGLGQSMRILANILDKNQIPFDIIQVSQPGRLKGDNHTWDYKIKDQPLYDTNLIHINASEWVENYLRLDVAILNYRKNIAYWLWELEEFPKKWQNCIETVDEVWAPSDFVCDSIRACTDKPVRKIPYAIETSTPTEYTREHFRLPNDVFLYLVMYDCQSVSERKNPQGAVDAFKRAFSVEYANAKKIGLILKVNHGKYENKLDALKKELQEYKYIYYITDVLSREEVYALEAIADVLVSLHRSEGFGLAVAEAMYLGTAVITTNWSATTEFTSEETACLVDYDIVELKHAIGPYKKGSRWADANINQAAEYMKMLFSDFELRNKKEEMAKNYICDVLSLQHSGEIIKETI